MSKYIKLEDALSLAKKGVLISNSNFDKVCKAIENLPTIEVSEDCISRADLIKSFLADNECERESAKACMCRLDYMLELIEDAPSVEPLKKVVAQVKVDIDELMERIKEEYEIEPIVRCKDCIYNAFYTDKIDGVECWCYKHSIDIGVDDYCSYGKRKEQEHE